MDETIYVLSVGNGYFPAQPVFVGIKWRCEELALQWVSRFKTVRFDSQEEGTSDWNFVDDAGRSWIGASIEPFGIDDTSKFDKFTKMDIRPASEGRGVYASAHMRIIITGG